MNYTALFLFCGLGGGALGFLQARARLFGSEATFRSLGGIDIDPAACADFEYLTKSPALCADMSQVTGAELRSFAGNVPPDVVFLSAPCKAFSGLLDPKLADTTKYVDMSRLALTGIELMLETWDVGPRLVILENVPRIASKGARLLLEIEALLDRAGYAVAMSSHDCGELGGLAQRRRRFLMVARHKSRTTGLLYQPQRQRVRGCGEVLGALPMPEDPAAGPMHRMPRLSWLNWVRLALIPAGGDHRDLEGELARWSGVPLRSPFPMPPPSPSHPVHRKIGCPPAGLRCRIGPRFPGRSRSPTARPSPQRGSVGTDRETQSRIREAGMPEDRANRVVCAVGSFANGGTMTDAATRAALQAQMDSYVGPPRPQPTPVATLAADPAPARPNGSTSKSVVVEGEVASVRFENASAGFRILMVTVVGKPKPEAWKGNFQAAAPGVRVRGTGVYKSDPKWGDQFMVTSLEVLVPTSSDGIEAYLAGGTIFGIGPALAKKIVSVFGEKTLDVIETDPSALLRVEGIGTEKLKAIKESYAKEQATARVMASLSQCGMSGGLAAKILRHYGAEKALEVVAKRPYLLALDIDGIGFKKADTIALASGIPSDSDERAQAGASHCLNEQTGKGHCYVTRREIVGAASELLQRDPCAVETAVDHLAQAGRVIIEALPEGEEAVYPRHLHRAEVKVAEALRALVAESPPKPKSGKPALSDAAETAIKAFEQRASVTLADAQRDAVVTAARAKVMVVTGGPGVGKTTVLRAILETFEAVGLRVALAAPTGRAAKRMAESTGHDATTIHSLLEFNPALGGPQRNREHPIEADAIICDEASMIDISLMHQLVAAVPAYARLVLIGDVDQLPSVGPGSVLRDVIDSTVVPTVRLSQVFRHAKGSMISLNAQKINTGEAPVNSEGPNGEFYVVERKGGAEGADAVVEMVTKRIPARFGFNPLTDIQVLTPMHKNESGTEALNERLQAALNPQGPNKVELKRGSLVVRVGDRVMQTKNDHDRKVYNGDVGFVASIDIEKRALQVRFDDRLVAYTSEQLEPLTLAYAVTIHKSQGSEYPVVVMPILTQHFVMLTRNIVYTGLTRGKKLVVLVADPKAIKLALAKDRLEPRNTRLAERLRGR